MAPEVLVALITSGVGLVVALVGVQLNNAVARKARHEQVQDVMARYRDPLLWSVHDLRGRIQTIVDHGFLVRYLVNGEDIVFGNGDDFARPYARRHTTFVLAEYLGWVEILRRTVGFLDLGDRQSNRRLVELLSVVRRVLLARNLDPVYHVPAGHQRAIGELMITSDAGAESRGWRCIGFAEFCRRLDTDPEFAAWFARIEQGIVASCTPPGQGHNRLVELNLRLTDLIDFLDPDGHRFPMRDIETPSYMVPGVLVSPDEEAIRPAKTVAATRRPYT